MSSTVQGFVNGRPSFQGQDTIEGSSFLKENRKICHLLPSKQIQNSILLFIERIFQKIICWLYPFERTPYVGIVAAFDRKSHSQKMDFATLDRKAIFSYFQRFVDSDTAAPPAIKECMDQLDEQYKAIEKLRLSDRYSEEYQKFKDPLELWIKDIETLEVGKQRLIVASDTAGDELFYLFSRDDEGLNFKMIGRGSSMVDLSGIQEVSVAGKAKIQSAITYRNIGQEHIRSLMEHTPLGIATAPYYSYDVNGGQTILEGLKPNLVESCLADNLAAKTHNFAKVFWTVLKQVNKNAGNQDVEASRLKLRCKVFTLFAILKEYRHTLSDHPEQIQTLDRMLRLCSQDLLLARQKGIVNKDEIDQLVSELSLVQQALKTAAESSKVSLPGLKMPGMGIFSLNALLAINIPTPVPEFQERAPLQSVRSPRGEPSSSLPVINWNPSRCIPSLNDLSENSTEQEIVLAIYAIDFSSDARTNYWKNLSKDEATAIMEKISALSTRLASGLKPPKELQLDTLEVLYKMTGIVAYLTHYVINDGDLTQGSYCCLIDLNEINIFFTDGLVREHCFGYCVHPENIGSYADLQAFYPDMIAACLASGFRYDVNAEYQSEESTRHLRIQNRLMADLLGILRGDGRWSWFWEDFNKASAVQSSLHGWAAPLPLSLLAVYHNLSMTIGSWGVPYSYFHRTGTSSIRGRGFAQTFEYRNTPEAIVDDPQSTIQKFEDFMMNINISSYRENINNRLAYADSWLSLERYSEEARQSINSLLKKQTENLIKASQIETKFTKEELTALLLLLRRDKPQTEIMAFMDTHASMLADPSVQYFLQLVFFQISLSKTLDGFWHNSRGIKERLPEFFSSKITEYRNKPDELPKLIFFLQFSERLKGIYTALKHNTNDFFDVASIQDELNEKMRSAALPPALLVQAVIPGLRAAFEKDALTQNEICKMIIDMQVLKKRSTNLSSFERREIFYLEGRYREFLKQLSSSGSLSVSEEHINYILDEICNQTGMLLDNSSWTGAALHFENDQYEIDLMEGTIREKTTGLAKSALPSGILTDAMFGKTYSDLLSREVHAMMKETEDGKKIYLFEDTHHNVCQIEEKDGVYSYYKAFPKSTHPGLLQAVTINPASSVDPLAALMGKKEESEGGFGIGALFSILKMALGLEEKIPKLPAIFNRGVFIDPNNPKTGYIVSDEGDFQFEVELEGEGADVKIKNVFDFRKGERSEAMQVVSSRDVDQSALKQLEQFEDPSHILLWGKNVSYLASFFTSSSVEKVEFSRYGLTFSLRDGKLVCDDQKYAGYTINLSASVEERKGFAFSMLLEHPDRTQPKKLLVPEASSIVPGIAFPETYSGLAYIIWMVKSLIAMYFDNSLASKVPPQHFHIGGESKHLNFVSVDLHPHTGELIYEKGKEIEHSQELIRQAILVGDYEIAFEVLHAVEIDKQEKPIKEWFRFIKSLKNEPFGSSIALKAIEKVMPLIKSEEWYKQMRKDLRSLRIDFFKTYLQQGKKLPAVLRLSKDAFDKAYATTKKKDPEYYRRHVIPFLRNIGENVEFPIIYVDGRETALPEMIDLHPARRNLPDKIELLEATLHPEQRLAAEELARSFTLISDAPPLFFSKDTLAEYFTGDKKVISSGKELLNHVIVPKKREIRKEHRLAKENLERLLSATDTLDQLAFFAKEKRIASPTDLMLALLQNDLEGLARQGYLPDGIDLNELKKAVTHFYDMEVKLQLITKCQKQLSKMAGEKNEMSRHLWRLRSSTLFDLLTHRRQYSIQENPELLIFEAFHFMTFRDSTEPSQLELLHTILENPMGITQAGTGSGKSSVLSVVRALIQPTGSNLVTHKALPHLYKEMLTLMEARFGKTFKRKVYPLRFDFRMPLEDKEGSIFKSMYQRMLETMQNKGCILTDYKSFPLLEEKFWSVSRELLASRAEGLEPDPLQLSHWTYLRKILILLQNKGEELMDEFDEPNRPVHRIQIQIKPGEKPPEFIIEESLALYDRLLKESNLKLAENLQGEISPETRMECLSRVAKEIAREKARGDVSSQEIHRYLLGKGDEALTKIAGWTREEQDTLALLKDQFYTYLPLTLSQSGISKYQKSADGNRIVTCVKGDPREAKFGNILEEINYSIQEYVQHGVALPTLSRWVREAIKDLKSGRDEAGAKARFNDVISGVSLEELACLNPDDLEDRIEEQFLTQVNQNQEAVRFFLERHLDSLRSSGYVASMTPQDIVAMSRAVSGISATVGSAGSLHSQFQTDKAASERVRQEMIDRIKRRSLGEPLLYDPADPLAIFNSLQTPITAIIDGSGAFREIAHEDVAKMMMQVNPSLKKVEYYGKDGSVQYVGDQNARVEEKGFYFPQAYTRGSDQVLKPDGIALLTVNDQDQIEDLGQQEGRMRLPGQKVIYALSQFAPSEMQSLSGIIERKEQNEEEQNAVDRFRSEPQRLRGVVRFTAKQELLKEETLDAFLPKFDPLQDLFIQSPASAYENPGDYFNKHQNITPRDCDPIEELQTLKDQLIQRSMTLGLPYNALSQISYSDDLRSQMPRSVAPLTAMETQLEVEEEREEQVEQEQEEEQEEDTETAVAAAGKVPSYLPRLLTSVVHLAKNKIHPSFDDKIKFTESFLPLDRKDPLHRRKAFDDRMHRVGVVNVTCDYLAAHHSNVEIENITIGDPLDDIAHTPLNTIQYNIRTGHLVDNNGRQSYAEQVIQDPNFKRLIAQIKFFDGQIEGYKPEELGFLSDWFQVNNNADKMITFFKEKILQNRSEKLRYEHSQIWDHFKDILDHA